MKGDSLVMGTFEDDDRELVQKRSLKGEVFEFLHKRIVAGKYAPGEWLRQEEISSLLGVSQTPVREALDLLVSVGLAERVPYRGVRVPEPTPEQIVDSYAMRLLMESAAARLAAHNASQDQLMVMAEIVAKTRPLVTLDDMSSQRQLNKMFHLTIAESSGSLLLTKLYQMTSNIFPDWMLYEYMFRHPELLESSLEKEYLEHQAIFDAIADHKAELAAQHTLEHIHNLGRELVDFLRIPASLVQKIEQQIAPLLATGHSEMKFR
ncbi:MAG: GntR family transcriptional regulator [Anaerolineales bacterium]|nr:GntR family transcriptional regulator [Anaerolineales bacterium]